MNSGRRLQAAAAGVNDAVVLLIRTLLLLKQPLQVIPVDRPSPFSWSLSRSSPSSSSDAIAVVHASSTRGRRVVVAAVVAGAVVVVLVNQGSRLTWCRDRAIEERGGEGAEQQQQQQDKRRKRTPPSEAVVVGWWRRRRQPVGSCSRCRRRQAVRLWSRQQQCARTP